MAATWDEFEQHAGKRVSIIRFGQPAPWNQDFAAAPLALASAHGAIPLLDMDPDGLDPLAPGGGESFTELFAQTYDELLVIAPAKPIMIAEVGATEARSSSPTERRSG